MNNTKIATIAIIAIAALLIAATAFNTPQALAGGHHHYKHKHRNHHHHDGQSARASISQENNQRAVCISGSSTTGSCNQAASNVNFGNAVAANVR
jgi:hypothetical protein